MFFYKCEKAVLSSGVHLKTIGTAGKALFLIERIKTT